MPWFGDMFGRRPPPPSAAELAASGARIVDVRTPEEFAGGHVEGAINVPVQVLAERLHEIGDRQHKVVLYCRSGARSARAAQMLRDAGFSDVLDIGPMPEGGAR